LIFIIILITRFLPELPALIRKHLPEGVLTMTDHRLSTTITQPLEIRDPEFLFLFDLSATESALESTDNGVLITQDKIISKSGTSSYQYQNYNQFPNFSFDKYQIADWLQSRRYQLWFYGMLLLLLVWGIILSFVWLTRLFLLAIWSLVFLIVDKFITKKNLSLAQIFNLMVYASVLPLLISLLLFIAPNNILSLINMVIFIYFSYSWIQNLPLAENSDLLKPLPKSNEKRKKSRT
jgi:hypothetical protein